MKSFLQSVQVPGLRESWPGTDDGLGFETICVDFGALHRDGKIVNHFY